MNYSIEKSLSPLDYESIGIFVTESLVYHDSTPEYSQIKHWIKYLDNHDLFHGKVQLLYIVPLLAYS